MQILALLANTDAIVIPTCCHVSQIDFEAKKGTGEESDVAIDDVYFVQGSCKGELGKIYARYLSFLTAKLKLHKLVDIVCQLSKFLDGIYS